MKYSNQPEKADFYWFAVFVAMMFCVGCMLP